jgi:hypothetical protein
MLLCVVAVALVGEVTQIMTRDYDSVIGVPYGAPPDNATETSSGTCLEMVDECARKRKVAVPWWLLLTLWSTSIAGMLVDMLKSKLAWQKTGILGSSDRARPEGERIDTALSHFKPKDDESRYIFIFHYSTVCRKRKYFVRRSCVCLASFPDAQSPQFLSQV